MGGQTISKIREESGAIISVDRKVNEKDQQVVTFKGTDQQIKQAEFLVNQEVREIKTREIGILKSKAGAILGWDGQRIGRFEEESGAFIWVDKKVNEKDERVVTILGTDQQLEQAEMLARKAVRGGARGGGGGD